MNRQFREKRVVAATVAGEEVLPAGAMPIAGVLTGSLGILAGEMGNRLRLEFPELGGIVIPMEPSWL